MKIVYCLRALSGQGGIERVIACKASYWAERGHEVIIVTTDQQGARMVFDLHPSIHCYDLGMNYEHDNQLGRWGRIRALRRKQKVHKQRLERLLLELDADICISTFFEDAPLLPKIKDRSRKVLELHSSRYRRVFMYPPEQKLLRAYGHYRIWQDERLARQYDRFVVLTQEDKGYWGNVPSVEAIPNPSPYTRLEHLPSEGRERVILAVGRYAYEKNFASLIRAFAPLAKDYPDWRLEIVGSGPERRALTAQVEGLGLQEQILLREATSDVKSYYLRSSIYALTSHFEGLPMVLLEAQAMGLPIVSYTTKTGPRDIVTDGVDGILVEQYDEVAFGHALRELMDDEGKRTRMGQAALRASERFALPEVMRRWEDLFRKLLDEEGR